MFANLDHGVALLLFVQIGNGFEWRTMPPVLMMWSSILRSILRSLLDLASSEAPLTASHATFASFFHRHSYNFL